MKLLPRFTFGMGDRFGQQAVAQLRAVLDARERGMDIAPVWNKSNREHLLIGTEPASLRTEADAAVASMSYKGPYFVDADHITQETVDPYLTCSDFFTLDVAGSLGRAPLLKMNRVSYLSALVDLGKVEIPGIADPLVFDQDTAARLVNYYGAAIEAASSLYSKIADLRLDNKFAIEVSMDETDIPQGPGELLGILRLLALEDIHVQTVAPKFTGRFNKGVDYVGDLGKFANEFELDVLVLQHAIEQFGLPESLKLSVHSGSDKFSLYPIIKDIIQRHGAGLHIKTAGTTWLEEVIGLAMAGGAGLQFVKDLYVEALDHYDELTAPYATVLDIDPASLPSADIAHNWDAETVVAMLEHDQENPRYNPGLRQFFHVAFKLAAKSGDRFYPLLRGHAGIINKRVHDNLLHNHILKVFPGVDR